MYEAQAVDFPTPEMPKMMTVPMLEEFGLFKYRRSLFPDVHE
jgi:hypothetical protein